MSLNDYRIFVEVAEQKNFTRAAERLNITPSAVSHSVLKMEKQYGFALFHRLNNEVILTHEGTLLLPDVYRILHSEERLCETLDKIQGRESGCVRIGAFNSFCVNYLAGLITSFREQHPEVSIYIYQGGYLDVCSWLANYTIDIGFISDMKRPELCQIPLLKDEIYCVTPKSFAARREAVVSVDEIRDYPLIMQRDDYGFESRKVIEKFKINGMISHCEAIDDASILAIIESGLGVSFLPELVLNHMDFQVNKYSLDPPIYREINLAYRNKTELSPAAKMMLKHIRDFFKEK